MSEKPPSRLQAVRETTTLGAVGLEMGMSVVIGYLVGHWLDGKFGTEPWLTIIWIGFGLGAAAKALWHAYVVAKRAGEEPHDGA